MPTAHEHCRLCADGYPCEQVMADDRLGMQACSTPTVGSSLLAGPLTAHSAPAVPACCSDSRQGAHRTTYAFVRCGGASHIWTQSAPRLYVPLSWLLRMPPTASLIWSKSFEPRCPGRGRPRYLRRAATNSGSEKLSLRPAIMPNHHSLCAHTSQGDECMHWRRGSTRKQYGHDQGRDALI